MIKPSSILIMLLSLPLCAQVKLTSGTDRVRVDINGQPFTALFVSADAPKPYLHPLRAASGKIVTRSYPMELVEGENRDHPHHRGLWFTHGDVNGFDFWGNEGGKGGPKRGKVLLKKIVDVKSGKKSGLIEAIFEWQTPSGQTLLAEHRKMIFYSHPVNRMIDFDITLEPLEKVRFGDTKEGTFAIRLASELEEATKPGQNPKRTGRMVNAEGAETEKNVWGKRSPWVDYFGEVQGEKLGITIMDHPASFRHPTYWHSRAYGLFAANAFGVHDFEGDNSKNGSVTAQPGSPLRFRYRVVIHPGDCKTAGIAELYKKYAALK